MRMNAINQRLATLSTEFSQNVLADEEEYVEPLTEVQVTGADPSLRAALAATAKARGLDAPYAVTLSRSSIEPFLQAATDRALREKLFKAWVRRGGNEGAHNNSAIIAETLSLRAEKAALLGYENYAAYKLADSMAGTPGRARALLDKVWAPARKRALEERDALQALAAEEGGNFELAAWDWRHYAEKLRQQRYDFDDAALKPYLPLDNVIAAAFDTAARLFSLSFRERHDVPVAARRVVDHRMEVNKGCVTVRVLVHDRAALGAVRQIGGADDGVSAVRTAQAVRRTEIPGRVIAHVLGIFAPHEPVIVPVMIGLVQLIANRLGTVRGIGGLREDAAVAYHLAGKRRISGRIGVAARRDVRKLADDRRLRQ